MASLYQMCVQNISQSITTLPPTLQEEIIKENDATFKMGINFENWKGDGTKYLHGFGVDDKSLNFEEIVKSGNVMSVGLTPNQTNYTITNLIANDYKLDDS